MKKFFATAVSAGILLFQATEVISPSGGWYWPFMDYPMYSESRPAGAIFYENRYVVLPCEADATPRVVDAGMLGVKFFDFQRLLDRAAAIQERWPTPPESRDAAIAELNRLRAIRVTGEICGAGVEVRRHRIEVGVGYREPPWELERSWSLDGSTPGGPGAVESDRAAPDGGV